MRIIIIYLDHGEQIQDEMNSVCNMNGSCVKNINLVGKYERKRQLGRPRHRWEDNIKMRLVEIGCDRTSGKFL
jgi:hypothetical protein